MQCKSEKIYNRVKKKSRANQCIQGRSLTIGTGGGAKWGKK